VIEFVKRKKLDDSLKIVWPNTSMSK